MDRQTYKTLKRARKTNVPPQEFEKLNISIPITQYALNMFISDARYVTDFSKLSPKFSNLEPTHAYKDELVITYLLFLGKFLNNSFLQHVFIIPYSNGFFLWNNIYKKIVYVLITLLYNKKFSDEDWVNLEDMTYELNKGYSNSVRNFLKQMKILTISDEQTIEMESKYNGYFTIDSNEFGPFYWRIIHFVAEAFGVRKNAETAKAIWKEFTLYILYRTLLCSICKMHYKEIIDKYKNQLQNSTDYAMLWFDIHNEVNKKIEKPEYSKDSFEKDRKIMRSLLIQK